MRCVCRCPTCARWVLPWLVCWALSWCCLYCPLSSPGLSWLTSAKNQTNNGACPSSVKLKPVATATGFFVPGLAGFRLAPVGALLTLGGHSVALSPGVSIHRLPAFLGASPPLPPALAVGFLAWLYLLDLLLYVYVELCNGFYQVKRCQRVGFCAVRCTFPAYARLYAGVD